MKLIRKLLSYVLVFVLCLSLIPVDEVYAVTDTEEVSDEIQLQGYHLNPLISDAVSKEEIKKAALRGKNSLKASKAQTYTTVTGIGGELRKQMIKHNNTVMINYKTTKKVSDEFIYDIYEETFKRTGKPTEGDYLKFQCACYGEGNGYKSGRYYNYTLIFYILYYTTVSQEAQVTKKVNQLKSELQLTENKFTYEKMKFIYDYICENVSYDYDHVEDDEYLLQYTAYAALIQHSAVCQGYAVLLYRLAEECGMDVCVIGGTGGGGPHAWNIMRIGDKYYNLDSTWDAGQMTYSYFLRGRNHFPDHEADSEYLVAAFQKKYPISTSDYHRCKTHIIEKKISKAAIKQDGYIVSRCTVCGDEKSKTVIAAPKTVLVSDVTYNGKSQTPTVTVKDNQGNKISKSQYKISYKNNKNVGKATVTIMFRGSRYSGNLKKSFAINPKGCSISDLKAKVKGFTAKWKKQKTHTSGYQIQYATNRSFVAAHTTTIVKNDIVTKSISKLKAKKKYYVRVRTYKKVGSAKYYSVWSGVKTVTTKK